MEILASQLDTLEIPPSFVIRCFVTGGCNFNPYLKHVPQLTFVRVVVKHGLCLSNFHTRNSQNGIYSGDDISVLVTNLLVSLSFAEHINRTGGSSHKVISRPPPLPSTDESKFIKSLVEWNISYRVWQHESNFVQTLHHLIPYEDSIRFEHRRGLWILRYWTCAYRSECNYDTENRVQLEHHGFHEDGTPMLDSLSTVSERSAKMSLDIYRCGCFKGCSRGCCCQRKGRETPCLLCSCCYSLNKVEPPLRHKKPPEHCRNPYDKNHD